MAADTQFGSTSTLSGMFYEIYGESIIQAVPDSAKLVKSVSFVSADKQLGNTYNVPVVLGEEGGYTYAAPGSGAFSVNSAIPLVTQNAKVDGYNILLQAGIDYESAARAASSKKAFREIAGLKVENMAASARRRQEMNAWYGQSSLGTGSAYSNVNSTTTTITFTTASWAPLIWGGRKGALLDAFNGATKLSANAALVVSSVDVANRKVTFTGNATDITSLQTSVATANFYWYGVTTDPTTTTTFQEALGIDQILTRSGTVHNISNTSYDLWAGNSYATGGALNLQKIVNGVSLAVNRGLDEDITVFCNPNTWAGLAADQAALRRYPGAEVTAKAGFQGIEFNHMSGKISIIGHGIIKEGEAFGMPLKRVKRIGAQDVSFVTPGDSSKGDIFVHASGNAGYLLRCFSNSAIFVEAPAKCVKWTGIVNPA